MRKHGLTFCISSIKNSSTSESLKRVSLVAITLFVIKSRDTSLNSLPLTPCRKMTASTSVIKRNRLVSNPFSFWYHCSRKPTSWTLQHKSLQGSLNSRQIFVIYQRVQWLVISDYFPGKKSLLVPSYRVEAAGKARLRF